MGEPFQDRLLATLKQRGARVQCEICSHNNWSVVDRPIGVALSEPDGGLRVPMPNIPSGVMICNNCGNIRTFAIVALGLQEVLKETSEQKEPAEKK